MGKLALKNSDPVLSCDAAQKFESSFLDSDAKVWNAMKMVGRKLGRGILNEYGCSRYAQESLSVLGLIGKGHNGGDALLGIGEMVRRGVVGRITLALTASKNSLKPNTRRALDQLQKQVSDKGLHIVNCEDERESSWLPEIENLLEFNQFDICIDGLIGMQFRPPIKPSNRKLIERINGTPGIRIRVAVDLPSGIGEESDEISFNADVTFATGVFKSPLLKERERCSIGSIRYLDIGFFTDAYDSKERVLVDSILDSLRMRRRTNVDKRSFGHLYILGGSKRMPGALVMSVRSALQSGVGLVTVCAPESLAPIVAPLVPEAMWIPWPETTSGGLGLEGLEFLGDIQSKATALLLGPGMGNDSETMSMLGELLKRWTGSTVLDADALQPSVIKWAQGLSIATPHLGEFKRIARLGGAVPDMVRELQKFSDEHSMVVALKGPLTRIADGEHLYLNTTGNSVLSRGGSGDLLAGLTAGILAQSPQETLSAVCKSVYWHGKAADLMANQCGQVAVRSTDLLDYYAEALRVEEMGIES